MVQYPWMREQLFDTLRTLAHVDYQRRAWVKHQYPPGVQFDNFDLAVHFLFDDTALFDAPEKTIGWILEDAYEVRTIQKGHEGY
jgi:aminoglycoside phosphotransferase (APT) family kinase protein